MSKTLEILKNPQLVISANGNHIYSQIAIKEAISELEAQEANSCEWHYNEGKIVNDEEWVGQCGAAWSFFDGTPKENGMDFCPKCGGKLIEKDT